MILAKGKVYLVGAGPGNPKFLTVRALELFNEVSVVVHDRLVSRDILELIPESVRRIDVGKSPHSSSWSQEDINSILVCEAIDGNNVLRLKGGDPMLFSRGGEEIETLRSEDIDYEVVPGVSSATGIPAYVGIPLTHRALSSSVVFVTGHEDRNKINPNLDFGKIASSVDTLVILMGVGTMRQIAEKLVRGGMPPSKHVAVIERGTRPDQQVSFSSLEKILDGDLTGQVTSPALIIVGDVVRLAKDFSDQEELPSASLQEELLESKTWCAAAEYS
jgi:uroporphyrin-III C-methyltransferase